MRTIIDIIKAGWGTVYLRPYLNEDEYKAVLHITPYNEEWPEGWVLIPLPSGAMLYQQNQYGVYRFICYDPDQPNGNHQLGLVSTNYGDVNVTGGWSLTERAVNSVMNNLQLVQVIINNKIRYLDIKEAEQIAELVGAEVCGTDTHHFRLVGEHKMEVNLLIL